MDRTAHILLIGNDAETSMLLHNELQGQGHQLDWALQAAEVLQPGNRSLADYDLVILDDSLSGMDVMTACRQLQTSEPELFILLLCKPLCTRTIIAGLEHGADEVLAKPVEPELIRARVAALLRRGEKTHRGKNRRHTDITAAPLEHGPLCIDHHKHQARLQGVDLALTAKEYDLLRLFASHPGQAFSRNELLERIWGHRFAGYEHTVNTHISRLRRKVEYSPTQPLWIRTVRGTGYRFADADEISALSSRSTWNSLSQSG